VELQALKELLKQQRGKNNMAFNMVEEALKAKKLPKEEKAQLANTLSEASGVEVKPQDLTPKNVEAVVKQEPTGTAKDKDAQRLLFSALGAALPTLIGAAFGGAEGGAMGAQAGGQFVQTLGAQAQKEKEDQAKADAAMKQAAAQKEKEDKEFGFKEAELAIKKEEAGIKADERAVPAFGNAKAKTKEAAADINKSVYAVGQAQEGINELLEIAKTPLNKIDPVTKSKAEVLATTIRANLRPEILGPGAVTETEYALMERIVADPTTIFALPAQQRQALKTLSQRLEGGLIEKAKAYGVDPSTYQSRIKSSNMEQDKISAALAWAESNPDDPRSKAIIDKINQSKMLAR